LLLLVFGLLVVGIGLWPRFILTMADTAITVATSVGVVVTVVVVIIVVVVSFMFFVIAIDVVAVVAVVVETVAVDNVEGYFNRRCIMHDLVLGEIVCIHIEQSQNFIYIK